MLKTVLEQVLLHLKTTWGMYGLISPKPAELVIQAWYVSPNLGFNHCSVTLRSLPTSQPPKCYVCISILPTLPACRCITLTQWNTFDQWSPLQIFQKMSLFEFNCYKLSRFLKTAISKHKTLIRKKCRKFIMYIFSHVYIYWYIYWVS